MVDELYKIDGIRHLEWDKPSMLGNSDVVVHEHHEDDEHVGGDHTSSSHQHSLVNIDPGRVTETQEDRMIILPARLWEKSSG
jgi:hypothetical protein